MIRQQMRKLEIGSGTRPTPGYEHCDINEALPELDFVCSMENIPVEDNTYDEVRTVHVIEHVPIGVGRNALREWYRIVKPGGLVHIDTPNFLLNAVRYVDVEGKSWLTDFNSLHPLEKEALTLNGVPNKTLWMNFKVFSTANQYDLHYCNYDADLLGALCQEAGFTRIKVVQYEPSLIIHAIK